MITAGVDIGSVAAKAVIYDTAEQRIIGSAVIPTGWNPKQSFDGALDEALKNAGAKRTDVCNLIATGYGRVTVKNEVSVVSEIRCHARGAHYSFADAEGVIDIGGQDSKAIRLARDGNAEDFIMNDKCAAGTGRFVQMAAMLLEMSLDEFSAAAGRGDPVAISSMCAVFAESEIISLLARRENPQDIAAGVALSIVKRTVGLAGRLGVEGPTVFTGGLAVSRTIADMLGRNLGRTIYVPEHPQIVGALGAALIAGDTVMKH